MYKKILEAAGDTVVEGGKAAAEKTESGIAFVGQKIAEGAGAVAGGASNYIL